MKPYFDDGQCVIYRGDCREILPFIGKDAVCVTDPPYGIGEGYHSFDDTKDSLANLISSVWPQIAEFKRVALTPGNANQRLYPAPTWTIAWVTPAGTGSGPWGFCCWQPVLVYGRDPYLQEGLGRRPDALVATEISEINGHPCPKPLGVWKWLIRRVSLETDVLVDPFMGSGTTLRVAKDFGQKAIGIEIEERYCEIAAKRLSQQVLEFGA